MELLETISNLIEPILATHDVYLDNIEYVKEGKDYYLRIYIEKNNGNLDMNTCVAVSEQISDMLDKEDPIAQEYYLEVSSPGVEKPLKTWEAVQQSVGEYVYAQFINPMNGMDEIEGTILNIQGEEIEFEYYVKNIRKKVTIPYSNIKFIRLAVKF